MNLLYKKGFFAALSLLLVFSLSACSLFGNPSSKQSSSTASSTGSKTSGSGISGNSASSSGSNSGTLTDGQYITSVEASALAYKEAVKWKENAVLWYISPTDMYIHYDWNNTDKAKSWTIGFSNTEDTTQVLVYIRDGVVQTMNGSTVDNVGNTRDVDCKAEYPLDVPNISMKQAVQVAIANGAPAGVLPANVQYDIEQLGMAGTPLWMIVYLFPSLSGDEELEERHFYYVDGLTGDFVKAGYKIGSDVVERSQLAVKEADYAASIALLDQRPTIVKFLALINEGRVEDAIGMMGPSAVPDESAKETWVGALSCIHGFQTDFVTAENEENWTDTMQTFEADLIIPANEDLSFGWVEGPQTRYITLIRDGNDWLIDAFSFQ
jgi:hypothetical protein